MDTQLFEAKYREWTKYTCYKNDIIGFTENALGLRTWSKMREMLTAILEYDRVAVKAGRKVSKTFSIAAITLFWTKVIGGNVLILSSSYPQVKSIIWKELTKLAPKVGYEPASIPLEPSTGIRNAQKEIVIQGRGADSRESAQGYSGHNALYIIDEASGVRDEILEAIEGNTLGGGKILLLGNPTRTVGYYYEAFTLKREEWYHITISALDSPNVTGESEIPGLANPDAIRKVITDHGENSPYYKIHVLGQFASGDGNNIITLELLEEARKRVGKQTSVLSIGVDVARFGDDDSVIQPVSGTRQYPMTTVHGQDGVQVAGKIKEVIKQYEKEFTKINVNIDVIGVGASVYDALCYSDLPSHVTVNALNVAEKATSENYAKLRDQLYFALADWLAEGGALEHTTSRLEAEMLAATYTFDAQGRYKVIPKDKMKELLNGKSPDLAEALMYALYTPEVAQTPFIANSHSQGIFS